MYPGGPYWDGFDYAIRVISWNITGEETGIWNVAASAVRWMKGG